MNPTASRGSHAAAPDAAPPSRSAPFTRTLVAAALALAGLQVALAAFVVVSRIAYPFELDWFEGPVLGEVLRLRAGLPVYVAPTVGYVPLVYAPLFLWAGALASFVVGPTFTALRMVAVLASAGTLVVLALWVARATGNRGAGLIAAGLYAGGQHLAESWLDIGRSDSLFVFLLVAGAWAYRATRGMRGAVAAGVLWALAFLTKQSAPLALAPLLAWLAWRDRGRGLAAIATFGVLAGAAALAVDRASHGWFAYYVFVLPRKFPLEPSFAARVALELAPLAPALLVTILGLARREPSRPGTRGDALAFAVGLVLSGAALGLYRGAGGNNLLAAALGMALVAGIGWGRLATWPAHVRVRAAATLALCVQLALLLRDPRAEIPTRADRAAGEDLVRRIAATAGPVYVSTHPYLARLAGKPENAHIAPLMDLVREPRDDVQRRLLASLRDSLAAHRWQLLVLDTRDWLGDEARRAGYVERARVFASDDAFWPVTGYRTRPEWVLVPAAAAP